MRTILSKLCGLVAAVGCVSAASAQVLPNPVPLPFPSFKWDQRYTPPRATFTSKVTACTQPQPTPAVALDDWLCTKTGPILRIGWWGWLSGTAQSQRPFYIAIYREDPANTCRPFPQPIYTACVVPDQVKLVSKSCEFVPGTNTNRPIYYLSAKLPTPFTQDGTPTNPQHYFLQISEIDTQSLQFGPEDFRWAGRRPIQVCPAMQRSAAGVFVQPILDACDNIEDDLSFRLFSRSITIVLNPAVAIPGSATISLYPVAGTGGDSLPMESLSLNFTKITYSVDPQRTNTVSVDFDSPDGNYIMEVRAPGALPQRIPVTLQEGTEYQPSSFFDVFYGDLDGDGFINTNDLAAMLGSFGRSS
ncbi:MAG: hypothetical protein J0L61_11835 [Planctomycetes bacterium]|nr:hypothetical protein [Planctomycetota bacterium]